MPPGRDDSGPPIGALPTELMAGPDGDTDPEIFRGSDSDITKRRCSTCGAEIGPDEGATLRGEIRAYERVYAYLVRTGVSPVTAARTIEAIRNS